MKLKIAATIIARRKFCAFVSHCFFHEITMLNCLLTKEYHSNIRFIKFWKVLYICKGFRRKIFSLEFLDCFTSIPTAQIKIMTAKAIAPTIRISFTSPSIIFKPKLSISMQKDMCFIFRQLAMNIQLCAITLYSLLTQ